MKKLLFLIAVAATTTIYSSCSTRDDQYTSEAFTETNEPIVDEEAQALNDLCIAIQKYNDSIAPNRTRGFKKWIIKAFCVIAGDGIGAISGGVVGAAVGSGIALTAVLAGVDKTVVSVFVGPPTPHFTRSHSGSDPDFTKTVINGNNYSTDFLDSIGYFHNRIIRALMNDSVRLSHFCTLTGYQKVKLINDLADTLGVYPLLNKKDINQMNTICLKANNLAKSLSTVSTFEGLYSKLRNASSSLDMTTAEMNVLNYFIDGLAEYDAEEIDGDYLRNVLHMVDSSSVSNDTKVKIGNAMIVTNASTVLWGESNLTEVLNQ